MINDDKTKQFERFQFSCTFIVQLRPRAIQWIYSDEPIKQVEDGISSACAKSHPEILAEDQERKNYKSSCETLRTVSGWLALAEARNERDDVE